MTLLGTPAFLVQTLPPIQSRIPREKEPLQHSSSAGLHSTRCLVTFTDVSAEDLQRLVKMDVSEKREYLAKTCMKIDYDEGTFPYEIAADFYLHSYNFCTKHGCDITKTSTLLSLLHTLYVESFGLGITSQESYELFKTLLLRHSCQRPPFSCGVFDKRDVEMITSYVLDTFYRHYKMYSYVYVCRRELEVKLRPPAHMSVDNTNQKFRCSTANEVDPRTEPLLGALFEEERRAKAVRDAAEAAKQSRLSQMNFQQRVEHKLAELETTVSTKVKELETSMQAG